MNAWWSRNVAQDLTILKNPRSIHVVQLLCGFMIFQKTRWFFSLHSSNWFKFYNRNWIYWLRDTISLTLILVLKGVATRVQMYSAFLDEIRYMDLQYKLVECNCGVGGAHFIPALCVPAQLPV